MRASSHKIRIFENVLLPTRRRMQLGTLAVGILLLFGIAARPVAAQDRPIFPPNRDVSVAYRVERDGQDLRIRVAWSSVLRALRLEADAGAPASLGGMPLPPGSRVIIDRGARRAFAVQDSTGLILNLPQLFSRAEASERELAAAQARREGVDHVAGLPCTVWRLLPRSDAPKRRPVRVCVTVDGVPLRAQEEGQRDKAEAISVRYGPQEQTLFRPPQSGLGGEAGRTLGRVLGGLLRGGQTEGNR
jgi:hypothetical protein